MARYLKSCLFPQSKPTSHVSPPSADLHSVTPTATHSLADMHTPTPTLPWKASFGRCSLLLPHSLIVVFPFYQWSGQIIVSILTEILNSCRTVLPNSKPSSAFLYLGSKGPYCSRLWMLWMPQTCGSRDSVGHFLLRTLNTRCPGT